MALYRTYRPATFAEVVGQEHVTEPLKRAIVNGRVNHAYLFSGPRGCGKTSSARILARSLNCVHGPTATPCGECDSSVALAPGGNGTLDVTELDAASHGGVDDTRDLRERAFFAPASSRYPRRKSRLNATSSAGTSEKASAIAVSAESGRTTVFVTHSADEAAFLGSRIVVLTSRPGRVALDITSPLPRCGKTTTACNLALGLCHQPELRSVLFDFDLRSPSVASVLGIAEPQPIISLL